MDRPTLTDADVEAAVRAYVARVARRYVALIVGAAALILIVVTVPTQTPDGSGGQSFGMTGGTAANGTQQGFTATDGGATGSSATAGSPTASGASSTQQVAGTGTGTGNAGARPRAGGGSSGSSSGNTAQPAAVTASGGVARSGVTCGPGVRQVTWSVYAPPCVPTFTGDNGGATSPGVTGKTITLSFRLGNSQQDAAVNAAAGTAAPAPDPVFVKDMNTYISYFNKQFELYGRQVVLKTFQGQGDYLSEDQGQGADKAQADAATAKAVGAFGDATFYLKGSDPYWRALAQQHVVAFGPLGYPQSYYEKYAPYWWSANPTGSQAADWFVNIACRRMADMKAIFSPDAVLQQKTRVFGLVHPDNPQYVQIADTIKSGLSRCGVKPQEASYSINVVQYQAQAANTMAQMQSAGVTTMLCYCDPLVPIFLENAAQGQHYQPEWVSTYWGDPQARQPAQGKWGGLIAMGGQYPDAKKTEAYQVFKAASGGKEPAEQYYAVAYTQLLQIFNGLQAAGPDLTPVSFARGTFALPTSGNGDMGLWTYGNDKFAPPSNGQVGGSIGWYDPNYTSTFDGQQGGYRNCDGGARYPYSRPDAWGGPRKQLACFGR